jgi:hypothetical protein
MDSFEPPARPPARRSGRQLGPRLIRRAPRGPLLAVVALLLVTGMVLVVNQRHSGDPLKVRRELRKF